MRTQLNMTPHTDLRAMLIASGVGQYNAVMSIPYMNFLPSTTDPYAQGVIQLVAGLQRLLNRRGARLEVDGGMGPQTVAALVAFAGPRWFDKSWAQLYGDVMNGRPWQGYKRIGRGVETTSRNGQTAMGYYRTFGQDDAPVIDVAPSPEDTSISVAPAPGPTQTPSDTSTTSIPSTQVAYETVPPAPTKAPSIGPARPSYAPAPQQPLAPAAGGFSWSSPMGLAVIAVGGLVVYKMATKKKRR